MTFRRGQLEYFVAVAQEGQMTRAARRLGVAQPALSQAIAQLESELGLRLLDRHARGVTLTDAGRTLYDKALVAVAASDDAVSAARLLARGQEGTIVFGFLGAPPSLDSRVEMEGFASRHPTIAMQYRELPFPPSSTPAWLASVDLAVSHAPPQHPDVWTRHVRNEGRYALMPASHRLAAREAVAPEDVLAERYIGFAQRVDPEWAGFWSLDDLRGCPPERVTDDGASNPAEVLAALARGGDALTLVPAAAATVLESVLAEVAAVPLRDAPPARITITGHRDMRNPHAQTLVGYVDELLSGGRHAQEGPAPTS
jgi:DNA-binding transcriptional LysR family regulator